MRHRVLVSPYIETSKNVYDRYEKLLHLHNSGLLMDESLEQAEFSVLRILLAATPGEEVTFEESFPHLCRYAAEASGAMKQYYSCTLEAWMKISVMIGTPAESQ